MYLSTGPEAAHRFNKGCGAQELVMQQRGKCGVTRQAQVPRRSFGLLAEGRALPPRMEVPGPTSGAGASDWREASMRVGILGSGLMGGKLGARPRNGKWLDAGRRV